MIENYKGLPGTEVASWGYVLAVAGIIAGGLPLLLALLVLLDRRARR